MSSPISPPCRLDHLVIAATDCATGVDWFHRISGISLPAGGQHLQMGTHNHVTALSRHAYLELIAIDESVTAPALPQGHSRWFGLDDSACQARLTDAPCLLSWAVATTDLDATLITVRNAGIDPGHPVSMSRGDLHWRLALRPDGSLACDGVFPILIEWPEGVNPVSRMQDQGLRLTRLHLMHPEVARISTAFQALGMAGPVCLSQGAAALQAEMCVADRQFHLK